MREKTTRYFVILFSGMSDDGILRTGNLKYKTHSGKYVNEYILIEVISKGFNVNDVFIKDVKELTEQDFIDYTEQHGDIKELPEENEGFL